MHAQCTHAARPQVVIISVQVMADASDNCARMLVANHRHPKIVTAVADALVNDKNAKLRQNCSVYLLEVRGWGS